MVLANSAQRDAAVAEPSSPRAVPPLAVVGLACRFPDSDDPAALLDVVLTGRRSFRRLPPGRIDLAEYYQSDRSVSDATYSTRAALIEGWRFEPAAFGVDDAAYATADPAHWLALETAARALSAAGLPAGTGLDRDRTGVIIGNTLAGDTSRANALRVRWPFVRRVLTDALGAGEISPDQASIVMDRAESGYLAPFPAIGPGSLAGGLPATIATTISNYFGFRGGSHAVDSDCSSSLQAVASACGALVAGDLDAVVAGGVDLSLDPLELIGLAKAGLLATTDVRIYDEEPTGFLPGEGCGVVVLMRTADARAAGLPVYAEILGWGVSAGAVAGEPQSLASSQLLAMERAYERSGVDPADINYLEGNGAGTRADDLAELTALSSIRAGAKRFAALGSVKANIGHAKAAAGAAGLIKTVLALGTGVVPPTTGAGRPHALISDGTARLSLPQQPADWDEGTRLAAVSTMGIGGSNVHVVLRHEPAPRPRQDRWLRTVPLLAKAVRPGPASALPPIPAAPESMPFLLHAPDRFALAAVLSRLADVATWMSDAELADLACMLGREPRSQGRVRVGLVATRPAQLAVLAREAASLLPQLGEGLLTLRPGIFAADNADGRVTLLLSGTSPERLEQSSDELISAVTHCLDTVRWLDSLGVLAASAVGHGLGALAGLAWAGVLGESEVVEIAELRAQFLSRSASNARAAAPPARPNPDQPGRHAAPRPTARRPAVPQSGPAGLRAAIAQRFRFGPPRRRLISTMTGAELDSVDAAVDLICSGFADADNLPAAIVTGAVGATLMLETGPGRALVSAAAGISKVPAISLHSGPQEPMHRARVAAALFAAGALTEPQPLFAGRQIRPVDIWREQVFITSPCETPPHPTLAFDDEQASQEAAGSPDAPAALVPAGSPIPAGSADTARAADAAGSTDRIPASRAHADEVSLASLRAMIERLLPARPPITKTPGHAPTVPAPAVSPEAANSGEAASSPEAASDTEAAPSPEAASITASASTTRAARAGAAARPAGPAGDDPIAVGAGRDADGDLESVPADRAAPPGDGLSAWARCFTEDLRLVARPKQLPAPLARRLFAAARNPDLADLGNLFSADPEAPRTLAIVEDPGDDRSRIAAVDAASDAVSTGELVVITTSANFTGFFATVHAEHPALGVTVLRVPARGTSPAAVLELAHAEPGRFRELVVSRDGTVAEPVLAEFALSGRAPCPVGPDDVVLVSRQARGAGLALAQVLACTGAGIAVVGRADSHDDSELIAGLEQLRSAGARVGYEIIDVTDARSLTAAVRRIEDRLGPVTAIAHASAPDDHVPSLSLTEPHLARAVAEAANTLDRLAGAIKPGQLRFIITAGSVAGRYGLAGAGLHALASGALAGRAADLAGGVAGCRALHLDLPAWTSSGLGDAPGLAAELAAAGCPPLEVSAVSRLLLKLLTTPGLPKRLAVHGRIGGLATAPVPSVSRAAMAAAGMPNGARFLRSVISHYPGIELIAEARLSLASDPYLDDYRVDGMPVLPPALALEALAQAASVLAGRPMRRATQVAITSPVLIPSAGEASLRVCALRDGDTIVAALRCADSSYLVDHARAEFSGAGEAELAQQTAFAAGTTALQPLAAGPSGLVDGAELYGPVCFQSGRFRRIALLPEVTARSGRALARGVDDVPWYPAGSALMRTTFLLGSPALNDAALQVLQACVPHRRVRAAGCDAVQFSGRAADGPVEIRAVAAPVRSVQSPGTGRPLHAPATSGNGPAVHVQDQAEANGHAVHVPGQPVAPQAETSGLRQAGTRLADQVRATIRVAATAVAEMTAEERADMEVAERRPQSRKSRRAPRRQPITGRHAVTHADAVPMAAEEADAANAQERADIVLAGDAMPVADTAAADTAAVGTAAADTAAAGTKAAEGEEDDPGVADTMSAANGVSAAGTTEPADPADTAASAETAEPATAVDPVSAPDLAVKTEPADTAEPAVASEPVVPSMPADTAEPADLPAPAVPAEPVVTGDTQMPADTTEPAVSATSASAAESVGTGPSADAELPDAVATARPATGQIPAEQPLTEQRWDIEAVDASGHLLTAWRGVRLHDSGPLPRNAAWPPTLLSVFLERRAAELGLGDGLRVTVSCGQPDGPVPQLLSAIPAQSAAHSGDRVAGGSAPGRTPMYAMNVPGAGPLAGFTLSSRAPVPVACGWSAVEAGHRQLQPPADLAAVCARLRAELPEAPGVLAARVQAITACLLAEPAVSGQLSLLHAAGNGWVVLGFGDCRIVCAVVEMSGVSAPVAIALMTGPPGREGGGHYTSAGPAERGLVVGREAAHSS